MMAIQRNVTRHRPGFHLIVLSIGFIVGGLFTQIARRFLPAGAVKEFLTTNVVPSLGPLQVDLVVLKFALGPIAIDFPVLGLLGVVLAYLIARSLF